MQTLIDTSSIKFLKLETSSECLIGRVRQLKICDDGIFVVNDIPRALYYFNNEGKFQHQIGKIGRGPGEYLGIGNIVINEKSNQIILFDPEECNFIIYNYKTGDYIRSFHNEYYPYGQFTALNDSIYALENSSYNSGISENPTILVLNDTGKIIKSFMNRPELEGKKSIIPISANTCYFSQNENGNYYIPLGDDVIYNLSSSGEKNDTVCCLHLKKDMFAMDVGENEYKKYRKNKYGPIQDLCVTNEGMFTCSVNFDDRPITLIGHLSSGVKIAGEIYGNVFDWPGLIIPLTTYKDYFVGKKNSVEVNSCKTAPLCMDENANPVIVFFKLKTNLK